MLDKRPEFKLRSLKTHSQTRPTSTVKKHACLQPEFDLISRLSLTLHEPFHPDKKLSTMTPV